MRTLDTKSSLICEECKSPYEATALLFGSTPGCSCECGWSSMTSREFRDLFGFSFSSFKRVLANRPASYAFAKSTSTGNARQRRTQRRHSIKLLNQEKARLATEEQ